MNWRRTVAAVMALGLAAGGLTNGSTAAAARPSVVPAARRLVMVSDSVGLGAIPQIKAAFGATWQVTVTGKPGLFTESLIGYVNAVPIGSFGESAVVATGYNYPYWDPARFDRSIDAMVAALKTKGVKRIFWVTMREVKPTYYPYWNGLTAAYKTLYGAYVGANRQLRRATDRHPQLSVVDWAAVADRTGLTADAIHLNTFGATRYAGLIRNAVVSGATRRPAGTVTQMQAIGVAGVPADAAAVSLNLTAINGRRSGFFTVWPCDSAQPAVAHLWHAPNLSANASVLVPLGPSGKVCLYQSTEAHAVIDIDGWVPPNAGFVALRSQLAWSTTAKGPPPPKAIVRVNLAALAGAPTAPFTAVVSLRSQAVTAGDLRLFTCGTTPPAVPTRSLEAGQALVSTQLVRTDANGDVCVQNTATTAHWLSLVGAFDATADVGVFNVRRVIDTRTAGGKLLPGQVRQVAVAGTAGIAAAPAPTGAWVSVTLLDAADSSAVKVWPCTVVDRGHVFFSTLPNHRLSNTGLVALGSTGMLCISSTVAGNVTVDASGWTGTAFVPTAWGRLLDTRA
jgi:hypothetical protein